MSTVAIDKLSVFSYLDYRIYLNEIGRLRFSGTGKCLTLRQWAKRLGYRCHRTMGRVLSGERLPSREMVERISVYFGHTEDEHRYFELLVERQRKKKLGADWTAVESKMQRLIPKAVDIEQINEQRFHFVANWYHLVIKQLVENQPEPLSAEQIHRKLKGKVGVEKIRDSLSKLSAMGFLERQGSCFLSKGYKLRTTDDVPSEAIRIHHKQMMKRAWESLDETPVETRENCALTLKFDKSRTQEAKEVIRRFREEFDERFSQKQGEDVAQLLVHFFFHT